MFACKRDQRFARLSLHVRRIDDGQLACRQSFGRDEVQHLERVFGRRLIVLVIGNKRAAKVGRDNFGWFEVFASKRRLAAAGWADQYHER